MQRKKGLGWGRAHAMHKSTACSKLCPSPAKLDSLPPVPHAACNFPGRSTALSSYASDVCLLLFARLWTNAEPQPPLAQLPKANMHLHASGIAAVSPTARTSRHMPVVPPPPFLLRHLPASHRQRLAVEGGHEAVACVQFGWVGGEDNARRSSAHLCLPRPCLLRLWRQASSACCADNGRASTRASRTPTRACITCSNGLGPQRAGRAGGRGCAPSRAR